MLVKDLKNLLENFSDNDFVVINNEIVNSLEKESGRDVSGYLSDWWKPLEQGNRAALRFTKLEELSDGKIYSVKF